MWALASLLACHKSYTMLIISLARSSDNRSLCLPMPDTMIPPSCCRARVTREGFQLYHTCRLGSLRQNAPPIPPALSGGRNRRNVWWRFVTDWSRCFTMADYGKNRSIGSGVSRPPQYSDSPLGPIVARVVVLWRGTNARVLRRRACLTAQHDDP